MCQQTAPISTVGRRVEEDKKDGAKLQPSQLSEGVNIMQTDKENPSILSVKSPCGNGCGVFSVGDCTPDIDGDGNFGCPVCGIIIFFDNSSEHLSSEHYGESSEHCGRVVCCICGEEIDLNKRAYWNADKNKNAHIHCAEKMIDVYKTQHASGGSYYDDNVPRIEDLFADAECGESYTITKEKMNALKYKTLPEFTGF